jgi:hypothetical protein
MPRSCFAIIGLLAVLAAPPGLAQTLEEFGLPRPQPPESLFQTQPLESPYQVPLPESLPQTPLPESLPQAIPLDPRGPSGQTPLTEQPIDPAQPGSPEAAPTSSLREFLGYRYLTSALDWVPGGGDHFGMFSVGWNHYQKAGIENGIGVGMDFNFLAGPTHTDMPPRVYDFSVAYQLRQRLGPLAFDLAASVQASGDFNASVRKAIRYPAHAVGFLALGPTLDLVFGVDYLDRDDIRLLPVAGVIWIPNSERRFELVFPRPRAVFRLTDEYRLYLAGELAGGTWEVYRAVAGDDLATYHCLRASIGVEHVETNRGRTALEIGYLFDRRLEFASGIANMNFDGAVEFRLVSSY